MKFESATLIADMIMCPESKCLTRENFFDLYGIPFRWKR